MSKELKLMVGYWVQLPHFHNYIAQVKEIKPHGIWVDIKGESHFAGLSEFIGIPLTPEVLDKCPQFGKCDEHEMSIANADGLLVIKYDYHFKRCFLEVNYEDIILPHIQYLHQMQQLVHSLFNTELIVNL